MLRHSARSFVSATGTTVCARDPEPPELVVRSDKAGSTHVDFPRTRTESYRCSWVETKIVCDLAQVALEAVREQRRSDGQCPRSARA